jgi:sugar/nucleoside kinase (ribokinase family)
MNGTFGGGIELLCIGNAILDIFAGADEGLLDRLGCTETVQHVEAEKFTALLEQLPPPLLYGSGGGAANAAKIAALLGIRTVFTGSAGGTAAGLDKPGRLFEAGLGAAGVTVILTGSAGVSGRCLMAGIPGGKTRIVAAPGAALAFGAADLGEDLVRDAGLVVLDGYMLGREALVRRVFELSGTYKKILALDLGSAFYAGAAAPLIARYCRDQRLVLFMNREEAEAFYLSLTGPNGGEGAAPGKGRHGDLPRRKIFPFFRELSRSGASPIIALKLGEEGAVVFAEGSDIVEKTLPLKPADSIGAGDAFAGAFLAAWIRGRALGECAALGNRSAGEILKVPGTGINREKTEFFKNFSF